MTSLNTLSLIVQAWIRWLRLQRALTWALRGLAMALALSLLIGGIGLYQAIMLRQEFLALIIALVTLLPALFGVVAYFWKINTLKAGRYFDHVFHLEERVSTALELSTADHTKEIIQEQLNDAVFVSSEVKPSRDLPLHLKKFDAISVLVLALLIGVLWFRGGTMFAAASQQRVVNQAIANQQAQIEEIIKEINKNKALTDEQKQALTKPLQQAAQGLNKNPSAENAVSVLTNTGEKLKALSDEQANQTSQALKETGDSLKSQAGTPLESTGKDLASGDFTKAASELQNMDLSKMSPEELEKLSEQLDTTAKSLASTNPQMSEALKQASEAIKSGDLTAGQKALANASTQLANTSQQVAASQMANRAANQMQTGAGQVLAAGGNPQTSQANTSAQAQGNNQGQQNNGGSGSGSGSGNASQSNQQGSEAGSSAIPQNNGASNGGESKYEQIYAPSLLNTKDGNTLTLPPSGKDGEVVGSSPTTATDGQSLVPYTNVYSRYDQVNHQAIENGQVPAQFMDVVRNYFNSLK